jgi:regulatory protein
MEGERAAESEGGRRAADPEEEQQRAKEYVLKLLSYRMRSVGETRDRLARRGFSPELIARTVRDLSQVGLLDDREFSRAWVRNRIATNPVGKRIIRLELARKGVSKAIVDGVLEEAAEEYDERELAMRVVRKKLRQYAHLDPVVARRRLTAALVRRGFDYEVIGAVTRELLELDEET